MLDGVGHVAQLEVPRAVLALPAEVGGPVIGTEDSGRARDMAG
jgi:hypothetical protein